MGVLKVFAGIARCVFPAMLAILLLVAAAPSAQATQGAAPMQLYEQKIKAGLVYNFLKSTSWPGMAQTDSGEMRLNVCLFGGDPFQGYLHPLEGRTAQRHVIAIRQLASIEGADDCHVLFIHREKNNVLPALLAQLEGKSVLTMSDMDEFSKRGGMIEFSTEKDRRVHLMINKKAVEDAGLDIQDSLLKLAQLVD